jgi:hypothetical protein
VPFDKHRFYDDGAFSVDKPPMTVGLLLRCYNVSLFILNCLNRRT